MYKRLIYRNPDIPDPTGGGTVGGSDGAAGSAAGGIAAGSGAASAAPARDYGRDIDSIRGQIGEFGKKFDSFLTEYQSKFGQPKQTENREPKLEDFNGGKTQQDVLAFIDARAKHLARSEFNSLQEENKKSQSASDAKAKRSANVQAHVGRIGEAMSRYKDFDQVVNNAAMQLPDTILDDVLESNHSADLQYHLSKNAGDLYKLVNAYNQSERAGAKMLGALEAKFEREAAERKAALKKTRFDATANVESEVGGNGGDDEENESIARESYKLKKRK